MSAQRPYSNTVSCCKYCYVRTRTDTMSIHEVRRAAKRCLGDDQYTRLFCAKEEDQDEGFFVKMSYLTKGALRVKVSPQELREHSKKAVAVLESISRKKEVDISDSVRYALKKYRKTQDRVEKVHRSVVNIQAMWRGKRVRQRPKKKSPKTLRGAKPSIPLSGHRERKDTTPKKTCIRKTRVLSRDSSSSSKTSSALSRSKKLPPNNNNVAAARKKPRSTTRRLFDDSWLQNFDETFEKMVHMSDRT